MVTQREEKERQKTRRTELGKFFYDLAKTTFAVMVVGNLLSMVTADEVGMITFWLLVFGIYLTFGFAYTANKILKS